jgi:hypothetical protein
VARVLEHSPRSAPATPARAAAPAPRSRDRLATFVLAGLLLLVLVAGGLLAGRRFGLSIGAAPTATALAPVPTTTPRAVLAPPPAAPPPAAPPLTTAPPARPAASPAPIAAPAQPAARPAPTSLPPTSPPAPTEPPATTAPAPAQQLATAQAAIDHGDFTSALIQLGALNTAAPGTEGLPDALYRAHLGYGQQLLDQGQLDESNAEFAEALAIRPGDAAAQAGQQQVALATLWQTMEGAWDHDEAAASAALEEILARDPGYRDANVKLYSLLVSRADRLLAAGDRDGAIQALQRAEQVYPEGGEARARLESLTAPTPTAAPQQAQPPQAAQPAPAAKPAQAAQPAQQQPASPQQQLQQGVQQGVQQVQQVIPQGIPIPGR